MEVGLRFVNSGASARARRESSRAPYLKENGDLSIQEKCSSKLSCSWTSAARAILVKLAKMAKIVI